MNRDQIKAITLAAQAVQDSVSAIRAAHSSVCAPGIANRLAESRLLGLITEACHLADGINAIHAIVTDDETDPRTDAVLMASAKLERVLRDDSTREDELRAAAVNLSAAIGRADLE